MNDKINSVLLVDDDKINNYINEKLIKKIDFAKNIKVSTNGQEAVDYLKNIQAEESPQLILLDINMPVMDGFEFIEAYKKFKKTNAIIIMLTTSTNSKDIDRVNNLNEVSGYLNKPLTEQKVTEIVQKFFT